MKKILSLLALSCLGMGAWAQSFIYKTSLLSLDDVAVDTDVPVVIFAGGNGGYQSFIKDNTSNYTHNNGTNATAIKDGTTDRAAWVFVIRKASDGTITIKDSHNKYWSKTSGNVSGTENVEDAATFNTTLQDATSKKYRLTYTDGGTTYNIVRNAGPVAMTTGTNWVDAQFYTFAYASFVLPFHVSESVSEANWYVVRQSTNVASYWRVADNAATNLGKVNVSSTVIDPENASQFAFCFVANDDNTFYIYNKETGKAVYADSEADHAPVKVSAEEKSAVKLRQNGSSYNFYVNDHANNTIAAWRDADDFVAISADRADYSGARPTFTEMKTYNVVVEGEESGALVINGHEYANNTSIFCPVIADVDTYCSAKEVSGTKTAISLSNETITVSYSPAATVTYVYKCEGQDDFTIVKDQSPSSEYEAPEVPVFGVITSLSKTGPIEDGAECVVNYTSTLPFTPGLVYRLRVRNSGNGKAVAYADSKPVTNSSTATNFALENLWTIERVAGTVNDYKIYNLGAGQYINGNGFSAAGKAYTIGQFNGKDGGFNFVVSGTTNNSLGDHNEGNTQLGEWNGGSNKNDAGSCFWVESITNEISNLTKMGDPTSHFLGECEIVISADIKATAVATPNIANVKALFAYRVDPSKYYRLKCQDTGRSNNYLYSDIHANTNGVVDDAGADHRLVKSQTATTVVNTLFRFEESEGAYYIQHVNSGKYLCSLNSGNVDLPFNKTSAGTYEPVQVNGKWWGIKRTGTNVHLHQSNHADKKLLLWGGLNAEAASNWTIEEVEELPITIKESKWASVCFPMAITLPEDLTAYYAQSVNAEGIVLKEIEGNVVPAQTPVLLTGEAGTYNLTIGGTAAAVEGNKFTGTTLPREGFDEATGFRYGLSNGEFMRISGNVIAANKAYYACDDNLTPAASALRIYVDESELTSIDNVETAAQCGVYHDLNGRMVAYPTNGVYVHNGKKVFIK